MTGDVRMTKLANASMIFHALVLDTHAVTIVVHSSLDEEERLAVRRINRFASNWLADIRQVTYPHLRGLISASALRAIHHSVNAASTTLHLTSIGKSKKRNPVAHRQRMWGFPGGIMQATGSWHDIYITCPKMD